MTAHLHFFFNCVLVLKCSLVDEPQDIMKNTKPYWVSPACFKQLPEKIFWEVNLK